MEKIYIIIREEVVGFEECIEMKVIKAFKTKEKARKYVESQKDFNGWECDSCMTTLGEKRWYMVAEMEVEE